ncbi:NAD(P)/FAD-dependent oxidoreductase [Occultella kanbiaonis]|uniref:NAD(P)/FAD-dependent oxidoreductase n=1 Tax=Occultella kanbiaonis TaxID=2675754 RepID=UPI0012B92527|nr:FAD-dependent oxidoreductase [Occultella kanbiaonis]
MNARVVLLGGGYVTLFAYRALMRRLGRQIRSGRVEIVVISPDDAHSFHGFTGEVIAGILPYERTRTPLAEVMPHARILPARAVRIDRRQRLVEIERVDDGVRSDLSYTALVVGTGGREPVGRVPGMAHHGRTLRGPGDILALSDRVATAVDATAGSVDRRILVVGGGLAGVELAAAAADRGAGDLQVTLVHSGPRLLPELDDQPRLRARARAELIRLGVAVRTGVRVAAVDDGGARLADGTYLRAGTVIATVGQSPVAIGGLEEFGDERGRLATGPDLSVTTGIWAAGDAARVVRPGTREPVPANALWAIKAGAHAGANVAASLHTDLGLPGYAGRVRRPFTYRGLGRAASFGLGRSISELYGIPFTGALAWVLRMVFFMRFMPSRRRALAVVGDLVSVRGRVRGGRGVQQVVPTAGGGSSVSRSGVPQVVPAAAGAGASVSRSGSRPEPAPSRLPVRQA